MYGSTASSATASSHLKGNVGHSIPDVRSMCLGTISLCLLDCSAHTSGHQRKKLGFDRYGFLRRDGDDELAPGSLAPGSLAAACNPASVPEERAPPCDDIVMAHASRHASRRTALYVLVFFEHICQLAHVPLHVLKLHRVVRLLRHFSPWLSVRHQRANGGCASAAVASLSGHDSG